MLDGQKTRCPHFSPRWGRHSCLPRKTATHLADRNVCPTGDTGSRGVAGGFRPGGNDVARRLRSRRMGRPARHPLLLCVAMGPPRPVAEHSRQPTRAIRQHANYGRRCSGCCSRCCLVVQASRLRRQPRRAATQGATAASAPLPTVDGKVLAVARPALSPLYRVFVPVDARQKPVGGRVYVPEAFYQELYRRAAPVEKPPAWLILGAVYRGDLDEGGRLRPACGRRAAGAIRSAGVRSGDSRAHSAANRRSESAARQRVARRPRDRTGMGARRRGLGIRGGRAGRLSPWRSRYVRRCVPPPD